MSDRKGIQPVKAATATPKVLPWAWHNPSKQTELRSEVNSAFHPSGVGKSNTGLVGWGEGGMRSLVSGGR